MRHGEWSGEELLNNLVEVKDAEKKLLSIYHYIL